MFKKLILLSILSIISTQAMDQWSKMDQPGELEPMVYVVLDSGLTVNIGVTIPLDSAMTVGDIVSKATSHLATVRRSESMAPMALAVPTEASVNAARVEEIVEKIDDDTLNMRRTIDKYKHNVFVLVKK